MKSRLIWTKFQGRYNHKRKEKYDMKIREDENEDSQKDANTKYYV